MRLNEIFFDAIFEYAWKFKTEKIVPACVKIADNYAVEFLNYYLHNKANSRYVFSNLSAEEALEKFKQEKGL